MAEPVEQVVSEHFPYLPLRILVAGRAIETEALLDTGFDGAVVLPGDLLGTEIPPESRAIWKLADGTEVEAPIYPATVRVAHLEPLSATVTVLGDEPIIGRELGDHFRITLDHGDRILVEP